MLILFGGSFDPIHIGHILIARDAKEKLGAKKVIFIPTYHAPLKTGHSASPEHRIEMLRLALEGEDGFEIEDYEIRKGGVSYTVDTLNYIVKKIGERPYFLIGADSALRLHLWKDPNRIFKLANLLIADRYGKKGEVESYFKERFPELRKGENYIFLDVRRIDISATEVRRRIKEGMSIYCMVPDRVRNYIEEKGLYR